MTNDLIGKFVETTDRKDSSVNIHFKTRSTIKGIFITDTHDYREMKNKNFWRIVPNTRFEEWRKTKDLSLTRLFSGAEFTRLSDDQG